MNLAIKNILDGQSTGVLNAECIKLTGRSDVFNAKSVRFDQYGQILISRRTVKPGTNLIIRFKDLPDTTAQFNDKDFRATSLTEVQWVEEIIDSDGLAYAIGVSYLYMD
jgi:hypothetical protein